MSISKRVVVFLLSGIIILFIGMIFWPFILNDIIKPFALVIWLLLRIFVLSVDQKYFWAIVIFSIIIFLFRLLPKEQDPVQSEAFSEENATVSNIKNWSILFAFSGQDVREDKVLKRELIHLLASVYASKRNTSTDFGIYDALMQGEIPLPEDICTFLFPKEQQASGSLIIKILHTIQNTSRKWIRQWTGQDKVDHDKMINEVLCFIETSLEINK
jgi:hypothetical protein